MIAAFIGAALSLTIVFLTRRDHISPLVAARWFVLALLVLFVGFFPGTVDLLGKYLGIGYPPIIPVLLALGAAMVKILLMDIERQRLNTKIDRLVQRMAILEQAVDEHTLVKVDFSDGSKRRDIK
jgi:hypothetical protein